MEHMDNQIFEKVLGNDYIMIKILRMLDLKQQLQLQSVCRRLQLLLTYCVWPKICRKMQMNRNELSQINDDEFFDMLQLNTANIEILTIDALNGASYQMYFPYYYENLIELHIKWCQLNYNVLTNIVNNCPRLQLLDYNEGRDDKTLFQMDIQPLEALWKLINLKVLIWRNLFKAISFKDLYLLATKVPLERLECYNVHVSKHDWNLGKTCPLTLNNLRVVEMDCVHNSYKYMNEYLEFLKKCPNLKEVQFHLPLIGYKDCLDIFKSLEKVKLVGYNLEQIWFIIKEAKLKHIEIMETEVFDTDSFSLTEEIQGVCDRLTTFKLMKSTHTTDTSGFWLRFFQLTLTTFENLQELVLRGLSVCDELLQAISLKCKQLRTLTLDGCMTSGKYVNHMKNIIELKIIDNSGSMTWHNMFSILKELSLLQYLEIDCMHLNRDNFQIPSYVTELANSLEILKIYRTEINENFWQDLLGTCEDSFQKLHTLKFAHYEAGTYFGYSFVECLPNLQTLEIEGKEFLAEDMIPTVKHLIHVKCINMRLLNIVEFLKCTRVQTFELFDMTIDYTDDDDSETTYALENDKEMLKYIRKATLPHSIFTQSLRFWQRCLEECPTFQFVCMGHSSQEEVLNALLEKSPSRRRIKSIHGNKDLSKLVQISLFGI